MVRTRQHQYLDVLSFPDGIDSFFFFFPLALSCEAMDKAVKPVAAWSDFSQIYKLWWYSFSFFLFPFCPLYCRYQCCCVSNRTGSLLGRLPIHRVSWECCHYILSLSLVVFFILSYLFVFFYELSTTSRALKRLVLRCNIHKNIASAYLSSICASFINGTSTQHNLGPIADIWFHFSVVFQIRRRKNTESQTLEQKFLE